jgi:hypothetical protein
LPSSFIQEDEHFNGTIVRFGTVRNKTLYTEYENVRAILSFLNVCLNDSSNNTSQQLYVWIEYLSQMNSGGYHFHKDELYNYCQMERYHGVNLLNTMKMYSKTDGRCEEVIRDIKEVQRICQNKKKKGNIRRSISMLMNRRGQEYINDDTDGYNKLLSIVDRIEDINGHGDVLDLVDHLVRSPDSMSSAGYSISYGRKVGDTMMINGDGNVRNTNNKGSVQWMSNLEKELEMEWEIEHGGTTRAGEKLLVPTTMPNDDKKITGKAVKKGATNHGETSVHFMTMHGLLDIALEKYDTIVVVGGSDNNIPGNVRSRGIKPFVIKNGFEEHMYFNDDDGGGGGGGGGENEEELHD